MLRSALFAAAAVATLASGLAPQTCGKKTPPAEIEPPPPPLPVTSATTPPIWHPPDSAGTGGSPTTTTATAPPPSAELVKARVASEAKDFKKVKALLEKKVRSGKGAPEEAQLVYRACLAIKDRPCSDAVKAKHPDDVSDP